MIIVRGWRPDHAELFAEVRSLYSYDGDELRATGWLNGEPWLAPILTDLDRLLGVEFTVVAYQAYRNGTAACHWHSDQNFDVQAILSLGATRTFCVCRTGGDPHAYRLEAGDLIFMPSGFQDEWEHSVPLEPDVDEERISLVFRTNKEN